MNAFEPGNESRTGEAAPGGLRDSISTAAQRIDEVVEAAERVAIELRDDARREADQYLEERREEADRLVSERASALSSLSDSLVRQVDDLGGQSRALASRIDGIAQEIRDVLQANVEVGGERPPGAPASLAEGPASSGAPPAARDTATESSPAGEQPSGVPPMEEHLEEEVVEGHEAPSSDEALLRATQMAIAGRSRGDIAEQLRSEFGLQDPTAVLDQVLGPS